jgi:hypothetical protein
VEFPGFQRFVGRYVWGFGGIGCWFDHRYFPSYGANTVSLASRGWQLCIGVQDRTRKPADPKASHTQPP